MKIIGLSNDIEWLQSQTKRLQVEMPKLRNIIFEPYNHKQVESILEQRIKEAGLVGDRACKMDADAIRYCAGQAASNKGGDLRNILDICKRALSVKSQLTGDIVITKEDIVLLYGTQCSKISQ